MKKINLVLLVLFLFSCSSPLDKAYNKENIESDMVEIKKSLSDEDFEMLAGYIALSELSDNNTLGKTYSDLLDEAKGLKEEMDKQEAEAKALAEKAKAEQLDRIKRLGSALTVSVYEKDFLKLEYVYKEYIEFKFIFENKTDKDIEAFTGKMVFKDLFDKDIKEVSITYDDGVPANDTIKWDAQMEYNSFIDSDVTLKSKDLDKMKLTWVPEQILFKDGSTLQ